MLHDLRLSKWVAGVTAHSDGDRRMTPLLWSSRIAQPGLHALRLECPGEWSSYGVVRSRDTVIGARRFVNHVLVAR